MPAQSVTERLRAGEVLLMDGGTGSELQRRGVEVLLGSRGDKLGPWSAMANLDAPDVVQQVHQDYLRVGADILISNNFRTTRTRLAPVGLVAIRRYRTRIAERARTRLPLPLRAPHRRRAGTPRTRWHSAPVACHAESIVRILKVWRNAGARGASADLNMVPPRTPTRGAPFSFSRTPRISLR